MANDGEVKYKVVIDDSGVDGQLSETEGKISKSSSGMASMAAGALAAVGAAAVAAGAAAFKVGMEWESAFAGVRKTVDATEAEFQRIEDALLEIAKTTPLVPAEIAGIAEAAGQLGVSTEYLVEFTKVMADLGVATNMTSEEAATALARIVNITGMAEENYSRLGSVIVALGNNFATTESEITAMTQRLAAAASAAGFSEAEMMALAAALSSVGIEAQAGGGAMTRVINSIGVAVAKGGEDLAGFAEISGMTASEFATMWEEDAAGALDAFIQGLAKIQEEGGNVSLALQQVGITETMATTALMGLAGAGNLFSDAMATANEAWGENNALTNEAAQRYATMESQLQLMGNKFSILGIQIYEGMQEPVGKALEGLNALLDTIANDGTLDMLTDTISDLGMMLADALIDVLPILLDLINTLIPPLVSIINTLLPSLVTLFSAVVPILNTIVSNLLPPLIDLFNAVAQPIMTLVNRLLPLLLELYGQIIEPMRELMENILPVLSQMFEQLIPPIITIIEACMPLLLELFNAIIEPLSQVANELLPLLAEMFTNLAGPLLGIIETLLPPLLELLIALIDPLMALVEALLPPLVEVINALLPPILELVEALLPPLISLFEFLMPLLTALTPIIQFLATMIGTVLTAAINAVMPIIDSLIDIFSGLISFLTGVFTGDWELVWEGIVSIFRGLVNLIPSIFESVINGAIGIVNGIIDGINSLTAEFGINAIPNIPTVSLPRFHVGGVFETSGSEGMAMLQDGEMVLTKKQQADLFAFLDGRGSMPTVSAPSQNSMDLNLQGDVYMDGQKVGTVVWENLDDVSAFN